MGKKDSGEGRGGTNGKVKRERMEGLRGITRKQECGRWKERMTRMDEEKVRDTVLQDKERWTVEVMRKGKLGLAGLGGNGRKRWLDETGRTEEGGETQ